MGSRGRSLQRRLREHVRYAAAGPSFDPSPCGQYGCVLQVAFNWLLLKLVRTSITSYFPLYADGTRDTARWCGRLASTYVAPDV